MPLKVGNQFDSNPVSHVLGISITRVLPIACLSRRKVPDDIPSGTFQEGTDKKIVQNRMNAGQSLETTSPDETHENGLGLIVKSMTQGNPGCRHPFGCSMQEGVANFSRGILQILSCRRRPLSDIQFVGDKAYSHFTT
jgi:hypothetical protein